MLTARKILSDWPDRDIAGVAQLVEHFLAKEDVESSSLFARSLRLRPRGSIPKRP